MMNAVSEAIQAGWDAPRVVTGEEPGIPDDSSDNDSRGGSILDYRVFGYLGGAIILVVLDGGDLMQTSVAVTGLAEHLTTWSPGLLEYSPDEIKISKIDKPYDDENWLPSAEDEDDSEYPRWHLAELLDDELQELASEYLLACAIRSLWDPTDPREGHRAWDVVAGAVEDPWDRELSSALGVLLIRAARRESRFGSQVSLIVHGGGAPELAADLLQRARATGPTAETDGWTDDKMRGHVLVERFMEEHQLLWNRILDDEAPEETENRSGRQLRTLLWAGLRALATMAMSLAHLSGPWQVLDELGGGTFVSILAQQEEEQNQEDAEEDIEEVEAAAAAHALVWLTIRHPELLDSPAGDSLIQQVVMDVTSFHQVFYAAMVMAGPGPLKAAMAEKHSPTLLRADIEDFAAALVATEGDHAEETADSYDDMHTALELVLAAGPDLDERVRYLLDIAGTAARLTDSDVNPRRNMEGHVSTPLCSPTTCSLNLRCTRPWLFTGTTTTTRSVCACSPSRHRYHPVAVGDLAAEFPDLTGDDPRLDPASRARALRWIENALQLAREQGREVSSEAALNCSADAHALVAAVIAKHDLPAGWPVQRVVSAGAEAAASILHSLQAAGLADEVFAES
jgi:hypothetical protein